MSIQRIMVVDDDTLSREFLVEAISQLGYHPIAAKSGNDALEQAKKERSAEEMRVARTQVAALHGVARLRRQSETSPRAA